MTLPIRETEASSSTPAAQPAYDAIVAEILQMRAFSKRRYAWIAQHGDLFLKIPRIGRDAELDARSAQARALAQQEFDELLILANLTSPVVRPTAFVSEYACLLLPRLQGTDLRPLLLDQSGSTRSRYAIIEALKILAHIHQASFGRAGTTLGHIPSAPAPSANNPGQEQGKAIVVEGFEIRNFMLQDTTDRVWFYDPHGLACGYPEEDVMRFIISLLMLNWSRSGWCKIWTSFSYRDLLASYQEASGVKLDAVRLRTCFRSNLKQRYTNASKSISLMPSIVQPLAKIYRNLYFGQINSWSACHEL